MSSFPAEDPDTNSRLRSRIFFGITILISLICLVWTLRGANLRLLRRELPHLHWGWLAFGMIADVLVYLVHALRWRIVLRPIERVSFWDTLRAIYVGLFANETLPLRPGELVRCYLLGLWTEIPVSVTLASALIERIFDGVWLVLCLFVAVHYVRLPQRFIVGAYFLVVLLVVVAVLLGIGMYSSQERLDRLLDSKHFRWVHILITDLHLIGHSRHLYYAALTSLVYIVIQALPIYGILRAYSRLNSAGMLVAFTLMVLLRLVAVIPQAPGNIGTFNAVAALGLHLFGVPQDIAKRFGFLLWAAVTIPLVIVGFAVLGITGTNMFEIHKHAQAHIKQRREAVAADAIDSPS